MKTFLRGLLNTFFPPACVNCFSLLNLPDTSEHNTPNDPALCGPCHDTLSLLPRGSPGALRYETAATRSLVQALKFDGVRGAAAPLGFWIARALRRDGYSPSTTVLVPIPLGRKRLRERGFNQAELIAREAARKGGFTVLPNLLARSRDTLPQTSLANKDARAANVTDCFTLVGSILPAVQTLILIDDVTTSGATFGEALRTLRTCFVGTTTCMAAAYRDYAVLYSH